MQLNAENAMQVMYAAKKYIVTNLSKKCTEFLLENLSADTAPQLLEQSILFDENYLKTKVLTKIEEEAPSVLSSEEFTTMSTDALHEVLQLRLWISNEIDVFNASIKWAANRCQQLKRTMDGANMREVLGDNLFLIRFPTMTIEDINNTIIPQDILTDQEGPQIIRYLTDKSKPEDLPFPIEPRFDRTPRALLIPALSRWPGSYIIPKRSFEKSTNLNCTLSRPIQIKKIFIHAFFDNSGFRRILTVRLRQNRNVLFNYYGEPAIIHEAEQGTPSHFAVEVKDACVKAGSLQVDIQLKIMQIENNNAFYATRFYPKAATNLSDNFVSVGFTAVVENLLVGFEYSPII